MRNKFIFISIFFLFLFSMVAILVRADVLDILKVQSNNNTNLIEPEFTAWRVISTGNESILYNYKFDGDKIVLIPKSDKPIIRQECYTKTSADRKQSSICKNVTYSYPQKIPVYDSKSKIGELDKDLNKTAKGEYEYTLSSNKSLYYKLGSMSIILVGDTSYVSNNTNITQEAGFVHLNTSTTIPYNSLSAYWSFDRDTASTAYDFSSHNNDLTYTTSFGTSAYSTAGGIYDGRYVADDASTGYAYVNDPADSSLDITDDFTIAFWILQNSTLGSDTPFFINKHSGNGDGSWNLWIENYASQNLIFQYQGDSPWITGPVIPYDTWTHVVMTYNDTTNQYRFLVNGALSSNDTYDMNILDVADNLFIGSENGYGNFFEGSLDELMILKTALSDAQAISIYRNQSARFMPTGEMLFQGINLGTNTTANVTLSGYETTLNSFLQGKFNDGAYQNFVSGAMNGYDLTGMTASNLNLTIRLVGNTTQNNVSFYTPIVAGNITLEGYGVAADATPPVVNLLAPSNNTSTNQATQSFNSSFTDETALANSTFYLYNSTNSVINTTTQTKTGTSNSTNLSVTLPYDGAFKWNYYVCDSSNNCAFNSTNYTITYDSTAPIMNIIYPGNTTYNIGPTQLNYSVDSASACWYSTDGGATNSSADATCSNFTGLTATEGSNTWTVYSNDSLNNIGSDSVTFNLFTRISACPITINYAGTYTLNQSLTSVGTCITTTVDGVIIEGAGFTITGDGTGSGIYARNSTSSSGVGKNIAVTNLTITNFATGIYTMGGNGCQEIASSGYGCPSGNVSVNYSNVSSINAHGGNAGDGSGKNGGNITLVNSYATTLDASGGNGAMGPPGGGADGGIINLTNSIVTAITNDGGNSPDIMAGNARHAGSLYVKNSTFTSFNARGGNSGGGTGGNGGNAYILQDASVNLTSVTFNLSRGSGTPDGSYGSLYINYTTSFVDTGAQYRSLYLHITNSSAGTIDWLEPVTIANSIAGDISLMNNSMSVNSTANPAINLSANITFYGIPVFSAPVITRDGSPCSSSICTALTSLSGGTVVINVTGWTTYSIEENDTQNPQIQFVSPTDNGTVIRNYILSNITVTDDGTINYINVSLYNSTGLVQQNITSTSPFYVNFTGLPEGTYYLNATTADLFGNLNNTETRTIIIDLTNPNATLLTPENNSYHNTDQNFTANLTDNYGLSNATITITNSTEDIVNQTTITLAGELQKVIGVVITLIDGVYDWFVSVFDSGGNNYITGNYTVTIDTTYPLIDFELPTPVNYYNSSSTNFTINISVIDINRNATTFNLYNSTGIFNSTQFLTATDSINYTGVPEGTYTYNVTVSDLAGNENSTSTRTIVIDTTAPAIATIIPLNNSVTGSSTVNFSANITDNLSGLNNMSFLLYYNNLTLLNRTDQSLTAQLFYQHNITIYNLVDGTYQWTYAACDMAENCILPANQIFYRMITDTTAPNLTVHQPEEDVLYIYTNAELMLNITAYDPNGLGVGWWSIDGGNNNTFTVTNNVSSITNMTWAQQPATTEARVLRVCVNDSVGNEVCSTINFRLRRTAGGGDEIDGGGGGSGSTGNGGNGTNQTNQTILTTEEQQALTPPGIVQSFVHFMDWIAIHLYPKDLKVGRFIAWFLLLLLLLIKPIKKAFRRYQLREGYR